MAILIPKKQKFKKQQKGRSFNKINLTLGLENLKFGNFGLIALNSSRVTGKEIESMRQLLTKTIKKAGRVVLRIFPHTPVTKKPIEVRMGKGKGAVNFWAAKVNAGSILCELDTNSKFLALDALNQVKKKLSFKTKIIVRYI